MQVSEGGWGSSSSFMNHARSFHPVGGVDEVVGGETKRTQALDLPYYPVPNKKESLVVRRVLCIFFFFSSSSHFLFCFLFSFWADQLLVALSGRGQGKRDEGEQKAAKKVRPFGRVCVCVRTILCVHVCMYGWMSQSRPNHHRLLVVGWLPKHPASTPPPPQAPDPDRLAGRPPPFGHMTT